MDEAEDILRKAQQRYDNAANRVGKIKGLAGARVEAEFNQSYMALVDAKEKYSNGPKIILIKRKYRDL